MKHFFYTSLIFFIVISSNADMTYIISKMKIFSGDNYKLTDQDKLRQKMINRKVYGSLHVQYIKTNKKSVVIGGFECLNNCLIIYTIKCKPNNASDIKKGIKINFSGILEYVSICENTKENLSGIFFYGSKSKNIQHIYKVYITIRNAEFHLLDAPIKN